MTKRPPIPPPLDSGAFQVRDARHAGVSTSRLRAQDLDKPFHAVRAHRAPSSIPELAAAYLPRMTEHQFFSHVTAAILYSVPLPWQLERRRELHVSVSKPHHPPQGKGIRGHLSSRRQRVRVKNGLRILAPAEAWCQLAAYLGYDELVVAGDHLVRRKSPASTLAELDAAVSSLGSRRHARAIRAALTYVRQGTDSPAETRLRLLIVASGLPEPLVGHEVTDAFGFVGTPDLAYPEQRIAIEYEGSVHQEDRRVYVDDIARREAFERAGWRVILVLKEHLRDNPAQVVHRIRSAIAERASLSQR